MHQGDSSAHQLLGQAIGCKSICCIYNCQHAWPLLSPWGCAQLRVTCKELMQLSDGLVEGTMPFDVTDDLSEAVQGSEAGRAQTRARSEAAQQQSSAHAAAASQQAEERVKMWDAKCGLLARCSRVHSLALKMSTALPFDKIQQLCTAAGGRITRLKLDLQKPTDHILHSFLAMVPSLSPGLLDLDVTISLDHPSHSITTLPPLLDLPATLESLSLTLKGKAVMRTWKALAGALAAATQLTRLRSLKVEFTDGDDQVDVSTLAPIATRLTHLHVDCYRAGGVSGLCKLLAACSASLTSLALPYFASVPGLAASLALPFIVPSAAGRPYLAQALAAAPNLQQLEVLRDRGPGDYMPMPDSQLAQALHAHASLRRLVIHSKELALGLTRAGLPPCSLQRMVIVLCNLGTASAEVLTQLLTLDLLSAGCRLAYGDASQPPRIRLASTASADLLYDLGQALGQPGMEIARQVDAGGEAQVPSAAPATLPGVWQVELDRRPGNLEERAVAAVLVSLPGLCMVGQLLTVFCEEAEAVGTGSSARLWLLPALARTARTSLSYNTSAELPRFAAALSFALSHGYLPQLQSLIFDYDVSKGSRKEELAALAQVSCARPGLEIIPAQPLSVAAIQKLRATVNAIPTAPSSAQQQGEPAIGGAGAAGARGQQAALTLSDEGRRLLLQQLLC